MTKYHSMTARRKVYAHKNRSIKGFAGNIVEPTLWVSAKGGLGKCKPDDLQALFEWFGCNHWECFSRVVSGWSLL